MAESGNAPVREAIARLERRYEQDKITALGKTPVATCCNIVFVPIRPGLFVAYKFFHPDSEFYPIFSKFCKGKISYSFQKTDIKHNKMVISLCKTRTVPIFVKKRSNQKKWICDTFYEWFSKCNSFPNARGNKVQLLTCFLQLHKFCKESAAACYWPLANVFCSLEFF